MTVHPSIPSLGVPWLSEVPDDVRSTFSEAQIAALMRTLGRQQAHHMVDYRVSIPVLFGKRYYLTLLVGQERRSVGRLDNEGQTDFTRIAILYSILTATLAGLLLFGMFCALYLIKSFSGINVLEGESPLHPLYLLLHK